MTTWYTQTWTNQHLEQVKLNPFDDKFFSLLIKISLISGTRRESAEKESTEYAEIKPQ